MHDLRAILKTGMVKERYSSGESCRRRRVLRFSGGRIRFSTIAVMPPAAIPDESRFFTHSGANCRICGCCETPRPTASDRAIIRIARRFSGSRETIRTRRRQWCRTSPTWRRRAPVPGYAAQNRLPPGTGRVQSASARRQIPHSDWRRRSTE